MAEIKRYKTGGYGAMVEDEDGRWLPREEVEAAIESVIDWCDRRRNAGGWTTLGMVQHKLRELLAPPADEPGDSAIPDAPPDYRHSPEWP